MSTFYNRDSNITVANPINSLTFYPSYGSKVTFSLNANKYETNDGYYNLIPLSINSLTAKFDLRYDLNEIEAQQLVHFIENKNGVYDITFTDPSSLYKNIDGFCTEYAINHINKNHYEVAISLDINESPNFLNWYDSSFINYVRKLWQGATQYNKYDILFFSAINNNNQLNNFYYCFNDHISSPSNLPGGASSNWTQDFFFEPDVSIQNTVNLKVSKINFKNSFTQNIKTQKNIAALNLTYKFINVTTHKARAILHFLENKGGYRRFGVNMNSVYNKPKVFYSPSWTHTWKYENSHDIEVQLIEDPLGIVSIN